MTFYLKYRPKTIEELDLASVRERLLGLVKHKKFSHAYIFFGPRGTGKTSTARILAREMGAEGIDVIEMDAASNRGIDDIRELRERVGLSPSLGKKKAYIIDEVHMLTMEAFNALLKTLEEPPDHVVFFLCTTEIEKVPETIISRCVSVPFQKAVSDEIVRSLLRTAKGEKLLVEKGVFELIASLTDGSFREAQSVLEEASTDGKTSISDIERVSGGSLSVMTKQYVDGVKRGAAKPALNAVSHVVDRSGNINIFSRNILQEIRTQLLGDINNERLLHVAKVVEDRVRTIKYAPLPELALEIAAIELAKEEGRGKKEEARESEEMGKPYGQLEQTKQKQLLRVAGGNDHRVIQPPPTISFDDFLSKWPAILSGVKTKNHGIVTLLSHCKPIRIEGCTITVEVSYQFHKDQLAQHRYRTLVEQAVQEVCGYPLVISYTLGSKTERVLKEYSADDNIRAVDESELVSVAEELFT